MSPAGAPRPIPLSRDHVVAAAVSLADRDGIERLSMRTLAASLGVQAMSLYNHLRNKEDLIDAMVDAVLGEIRLPPPGPDWRAALRGRALSMRAAFVAHPWAPPLVVGRLNTGPSSLALFDATIGSLVAAGADYASADHLCNAMDSLIYGYHLLERSFPLPPESYADAARDFLPLIDAGRLPHLHAMALLVAREEHSGIHDFGFAVDLMLDAIGRRMPGG